MLSAISLHRWSETITLQLRHSERKGEANHRRFHCLLNRLIRRRSKKISKLRVTGFVQGMWPVNYPHKGSVTRKMFPFDHIIMRMICVNPMWSFYICHIIPKGITSICCILPPHCNVYRNTLYSLRIYLVPSSVMVQHKTYIHVYQIKTGFYRFWFIVVSLYDCWCFIT